MATLRHLASVFGTLTLIGVGLAACSSDTDPANAGGNSTGGAGGTTGDPWKKGKIGKATDAKVISSNGGPILGLDIKQTEKTASQPMDLKVPYKPMDNGVNDGGLPPTIPSVDFSEASPSSVLVLGVPPYLDTDNKPAYPPYTVYVHPDTTVEAIQHYKSWETDLALQCYGTFPVTVNGNNLRSYGGIVWDMVTGQGRNFGITSADNKVVELLPNGDIKTLASDIVSPSSLMYHPQGWLVVTTPPLYTKNLPDSVPEKGVELYKVTTDTNEKNLVATLPVPSDYATSTNVPTCYVYPNATTAVPNVLRIPVAVMSDGSYLVGDVGAKRLYKVSTDGASITEFASLPSMLVAALVVAPNDVVYMVTAPLLGDKNDGNGAFVIKGVTVSAYDETNKNWVELMELPGYENFANSMSWGNNAVPCPDQFQDAGLAYCLQPLGVYLKVVPGQTQTTPFLLISDPITYRLFQLKLDLGGGEDAGTGGSTGSGGSSGEGGASGTGGEAGASGSGGDGGSGGTSETGGSGGDGGSSGQGGSSGDGGSGGSSGEGGASGGGGDGDASAD